MHTPPPEPVTIRVDYNDMLTGGRLRAHIRNAAAPITVGETVTATDHIEDLTCNGTVEHIDVDTGRVTLLIDWTTRQGTG